MGGGVTLQTEEEDGNGSLCISSLCKRIPTTSLLLPPIPNLDSLLPPRHACRLLVSQASARSNGADLAYCELESPAKNRQKELITIHAPGLR